MKNKIAMKKIRENIFEYIALLLFAITNIILHFVHEPCFDEAESWQLAKCNSFYDLLFTIPHYEGHPQLWHLILSVPAKLGVPYEIALKGIGFILIIAVVVMILFYSPFPRLLKLSLPFTYFIVYQYGAIIRPYSILMLSLLFMAKGFKDRNEKPWRFVIPTIFLCFSSAYGLIIAGGIYMVWGIEILKSHKWNAKEVLKENVVFPMLCVLLTAVVITMSIAPYSDTFATNLSRENGVIRWLVYTFLQMPSDCFMGTVIASASPSPVLNNDIGMILSTVFATLLFAGLLFLISSKEKIKYLICPYTLFSLFSSITYFSSHHLGVVFSLFLFYLWISFEDGKFDGLNYLSNIKGLTSYKAKLKVLILIIVALFIIVPVFDGVASVYLDYKYQYTPSKEAADFIKRNGLENLIIYDTWQKPALKAASRQEENVNQHSEFVGILPYFDRNIIANLNFGEDSKAYNNHIYLSEADNTMIKDRWGEGQVPDILLGDVDISEIFPQITMKDYTCVYKIKHADYIWMGDAPFRTDKIYMRNDLLDKSYN